MIKLKNLYKTYDAEGEKVEAIKDVTLNINKGEIYGIIGFSGAGKSTLVRCINFLERPTKGQVLILEIIFRVYLKESIPNIIRATTITFVSLVGLTAMAGSVGGGGLGDLAIRYGYQRNQTNSNTSVALHNDLFDIDEEGILLIINIEVDYVLEKLSNLYKFH